LPIELEHRAYWPVKQLNFDLKASRERRLLQLNELEELRLDAYESSKVYKGKMKKWHDKCILQREFTEGSLVLLFNSHLNLFSRKLCSRWFEPSKVVKVLLYGAVEV